MKDNKNKFVFTQISAPIVGAFVFYAAFKLLFYFISDWFQPDKITHVAPVAAALIFAFMCGMVLWGKILILIGCLSKQEARGYPFSKPWENNGKEKR